MKHCCLDEKRTQEDCCRMRIKVSGLLGRVCRETRDSFVLNVRRRDAETLRDAINENIEPGTRLITDCWRGYANLSHYGWVHEQANHSINFVNPEDPDIHTQTIERVWKTLKKTIPKECNSRQRWEYVNEFLFKQRNN